jgi:glyoxylase-like metal-dependent hydrolase (beta-lactamase superfamily II)
MKEIADGVIIETGFSGVTLGAVQTSQGVIMIDTPLYTKDSQSWRTTVSKSGIGLERLLVILDEHYDRTISARLMRCSVITHENTAQSIASRPSNVRMPISLTGCDWEKLGNLGPLHWIRPEITFSLKMRVEWSDDPVELEFHPGPANGAIWVVLSRRKVAFVGDTVTPNQPPFLASANINDWLETLKYLKTAIFREYLVIGGRSGLVTKEDVKVQIGFLKIVKKKLEKLASINANQDAVEKIALELAASFQPKSNKVRELYETRLRWGMIQYYNNHYCVTKR